MIRLDHVTKSYGEQLVIRNFSYVFPQTGLFRLCGNSGVGKTTLLRLIAGLESPDSGTVQTDGRVSFLFQDRRLFEGLTALDNVRIVDTSKAPAVDVRERAARLLETLGIAPTEQNKRIPALSGGMQQRVAIARALFFDAPILLLDEPTKELDAQNRAVLHDLFAEEATRRLVILSGHETDDGAYADMTEITLDALPDRGDPGRTIPLP